MKVLLINGSPHAAGCTHAALAEAARVLRGEGIETELIHGAADLEGMQTVRNLARNMAWLLRCIEAGRRAGVAAPEAERGARTNFIR